VIFWGFVPLVAANFGPTGFRIVLGACLASVGMDADFVGPAGLDRAFEAAVALDAEGLAVTARAVRERAGVRMAVASQAAREWVRQRVDSEGVPEIPEVVMVRFTGLWREAFLAAQGSFEVERDGWLRQLDKGRGELSQLQIAMDELESEYEHASGRLHNLETDQDALRSEIDSLRGELASERERAREAEQRAAGAEARALTLQEMLDKTLAAKPGARPRAKTPVAS